jgi:hypothetical protein
VELSTPRGFDGGEIAMDAAVDCPVPDRVDVRADVAACADELVGAGAATTANAH